MKKLESLDASKFEVLSNEAMLFIVGGQNTRSPAGCYANKDCSNDYVDGQGVIHIMSGPGNDISDHMMDRICGPEFIAPHAGEVDYEEWIQIIAVENVECY